MEKRGVAAVRVPEGKDVVVVGFGGVPRWVLAGSVRGDEEGAVEGAVDEGEVGGVEGGGLDFAEDFGVPSVLCGGDEGGEGGVWGDFF